MINKEEIREFVEDMLELMKEIDCHTSCLTFTYDLKEHQNAEASCLIKITKKNTQEKSLN